jgi:hypothetical protein
MNRWSKRLRARVRKDAVAREVEEELRLHREMQAAQNVREGMVPRRQDGRMSPSSSWFAGERAEAGRVSQA